MSTISDNYIKSILCKVCEVCGITEWKYSRQKFEVVAQNYFGELVPVVLNGKVNEVEICKCLVLKLAPTDERYRVSGAITLMFAREIFVYVTILDKYRYLQETIPLTRFIAPICYYVCKEYCNEVIVMQNLTSEGYRPYTKSLFLDYIHMTLALEALAKFHALSFILRARDPEVYTEASEICLPLTAKTNGRFIDILLDRLNKALMKFENTNYASLLKQLQQNCLEYVEDISGSVEDTCICHGDIWKENIMFQYEDDKPTSACLIDYQTARMSSPAFDLLYLIASSTDTESRRHHYYEFLNIYYKTFHQLLLEAGLDSQEVYSRRRLDLDLKMVAPACFIIANTALWLWNGLQEEGHVRSKHVWSTQEEKNTAVEKYKSVIKNIIDDFYNYKYFST